MRELRGGGGGGGGGGGEGFRRFLILLSSSSHMCSIGVKSGLYGGHASGAMLLFARKSWQTRATCGRALSCCRIRLRCCTSGTATGRKISSLYLTAVILPATIISCDFIPWAIKSWQTRATCGRALSCCRIRLRCCTSGTATGRKIYTLLRSYCPQQ